MQLTRAADYAVRVVVHLAAVPAERRASRSELARAAEVPEAFLGKILQSLVRSGLMVSQRGKSGGFALGRAPEDMTLLDIIEAVEGPVFLNRCVNPGEGCHRSSWCGAHRLWSEAQAAMLTVLRRASIAELAAASAANTATAGMRCALEDVAAQSPTGRTPATLRSDPWT